MISVREDIQTNMDGKLNLYRTLYDIVYKESIHIKYNGVKARITLHVATEFYTMVARLQIRMKEQLTEQYDK